MAREFKDTEVRIPNCRLSYAFVWRPRIEEDGSQGKYSASLIIPKTDKTTIKKIQAAVEAAKKEGKSKLAGKNGIIPNNIHMPLRDADEEGLVTIYIENRGLFNRIAQKFLGKPEISQVHLEKTGSFIWPLIDGERTIFEIGKIVGDHFGNDADPLYIRLSDYFRLLKNCGFVKLERVKAE